MPKYVTKPNNRVLAFDSNRLAAYTIRILEQHQELNKDLLLKGVNSKLRQETVTAEEVTHAFTMSALELITKEEPNWKYVVARSLLTSLYKKAAYNRHYKSYPDEPYGSFIT